MALRTAFDTAQDDFAHAGGVDALLGGDLVAALGGQAGAGGGLAEWVELAKVGVDGAGAV